MRHSKSATLTGKGSLFVKRGENGRFPLDFRLWAVQQMQDCPNIKALAKRIGVHYTQLYRWKKNPVHPDARKRNEKQQQPPAELSLQEELQHAQQAYGQKCLELDFLKGVLHKVEARRQKNENSGETTSMEKCKR